MADDFPRPASDDERYITLPRDLTPELLAAAMQAARAHVTGAEDAAHLVEAIYNAICRAWDESAPRRIGAQRAQPPKR